MSHTHSGRVARRSKSDGTESSPQKPTGLFFFLKQIPRYLNLKKICILFEFFKKTKRTVHGERDNERSRDLAVAIWRAL